MRLSIIVPVYNSKQYMKQCIDSILNQNYIDTEIIIVDDGSEDGSSEICDIYQKADSRVKVLHQKNRGCLYARLSGLQKSNGDYIGFVDSDDWIAPDMYQILMSVIEKNRCDIVSMGYTVVCGKEERQEDDSTLFGYYEKGRNMDTLLSSMMYDSKEEKRGVHPSLCSKVFKRELIMDVISEVDGNISMGEDAAVFYPCCLKAKSIYVMKEYKYYYRVHNESMCRTLKFDTIVNIFSFYQYMEKILGKYEEKYHLHKQLKKYLWSFVNPWLKQMFDLQVGLSYLFPYAIVDRGVNIVLYGSGEVGRAYFKQIIGNHYCNIVAWVDKKADEDIGILYPERIPEFQYNKIVIAVADDKVASEIIDELSAFGIDRMNILWVEPQAMLPNFL